MEDEESRLKRRLANLLKFEGEDRVRHFLRKTLPTTHAHGAFTSQTLSGVLETNKSVMNDLLNGTNGRRKVLSGEEYDLLFPVSGHVSPGSLDIAVMFLLIRYLCRTRSIAWEGWDRYPSPAQKTPVHDIARVHSIYQDLVVKATTTVTSENFCSLWDELSSAILRLGGLRDRVERWREDVPVSELPDREREPDPIPGSPEGASAAEWSAPYPPEGQGLSRSFSCGSDASSEGSALCSLEEPPPSESTNPKQPQAASAAAAPSGVQQYYLSNVQNVQIGMQTQMSIASEGSQNRTSSEIAAEDHLELVMTSCRSALRNEYRRNLSRIQPLPWNKSFCVPIDDVYTNLDLLEETMEGFKVNRVSLGSMEDIFRPRKKLGRRRPLRIVMQGQAGVGKTTSLTKLAVDWSMEKVQALKRINLAFVLRLRLIGQGMSIIDAIFDQLMPKGFSYTKEDLAKCLEEKQGEVLILLDGYDEFDSARCPDITELLKGRVYPRAVVMTTTRPSKVDEIQPTADTVVEITGFSPDNVRQYLQRHFQGQEGKVHDLLQHLEPHIANRGIATIPMFTMLISVLYEDKPDIVLPATITGLYQELMSCIIKRYQAKHGEDSASGDIASLLEVVSKMAFECLLSDQVSFGEADLLRKTMDRRVAELGVFSYDDKQPHSRVNGGRHLTFSHKTIQEYMAGCHLANILTTSKRETKKYLTSIQTLQRASELKYVILFACGTSERAATALVEHLLRIWKNAPAETKKQKHQEFVKLSLQCLYESRAKDKIQLPVFELFPSGKVEFYDVSADVVKYLAYYLQHLKQVEAVTEVSLGDVRGASLQDADDLGTALLGLNAMQTLRISRSPHFKIKPIIEKFEKMPSLQHLYLCGMNLREEGETLAVALKRIHRAKRTLKTLRVADNNFSKEATSLLTAIGKLTSLTDVDVSVNDLGDTLETLSDSLKYLSELRTLNLRESGMTQKACVALGDAFKTCPLGNLEECNLEGNQVDDRASVQILLEGLGSLTNIRSLNLKGCRIGPDGAVTLSGSLQTLPHLRVVNLEGNGLDLRAAKSLFTSLHHCPGLETVDLNTNFLGSEGVGEFAANFEKAGSLTSINLSHNVVGDEGLEAVSRHAHHLQHLQYLELSDNPMTNDGFGAFFKNLPEMLELKELDLSGPYGGKLAVTDNCVDHLSQALSRVPSLELQEGKSSACIGLQ
ncbi:NLRC4 [Branchiostoma lanceolatum]|uniref:NLRC4 protein n=1 Tax=Branchiostoma lanceolatum TaxID=7740 RepID=A0A8J9ZRP6_BRALA|nr:NLRC4 [Branchiostoma lanceolatum]